MRVHSALVYIAIFFVTDVTFAREEWVDPHDLNIKKPVKEQKTQNSNENYNNCKNNMFIDKSSSHLRRFIKLITDMTHFDRRSEVYKGVIDIHLNTDDYNFLRKYTSSELNEDLILRELSDVMERSLENSIYSSYFFSIGEYTYLMIFNENTLLIIGLLGTFYVLWRIQPHNYKLATLFKLFLPIVYISDFVLRYRAKLEEAEIDKYLKYENYSECDPTNLGWFDWIYNKFTGYCQNNKREFLLSQRATIHLFTPLNVISEQFDIFVTILKHLGAGCGSFMWALMSNMPWYLKPFIGVFSLLLVLIILLMMGSYIFKVTPKFNLFYLFQFEVSHWKSVQKDNGKQTSQDSLTGENLKNLLKLKNQNNSVVMLAGTSTKKKNSVTFKTKPKFSIKKKSKSSITSNDFVVLQEND